MKVLDQFSAGRFTSQSNEKQPLTNSKRWQFSCFLSKSNQIHISASRKCWKNHKHSLKIHTATFKRETCSLSPCGWSAAFSCILTAAGAKGSFTLWFRPEQSGTKLNIFISSQLSRGFATITARHRDAAWNSARRNVSSTTKWPDPVSFYGAHADKGAAGLMQTTQLRLWSASRFPPWPEHPHCRFTAQFSQITSFSLHSLIWSCDLHVTLWWSVLWVISGCGGQVVPLCPPLLTSNWANWSRFHGLDCN